MRVLVISSCTGDKKYKVENQLTKQDFQRGHDHIKKRERELADYMLPVEEMYTGQQHVRLMQGIESVKNKISVDLRILSAGYGLIEHNRKIAPYECTFQKMSDRGILNWANFLNIPSDFRKIITEKYDLGLVLLGENYLKACDFGEELLFRYRTLIFCGKQFARKLPNWQNTKVIPLSESETRRFSCGLVALKGEIGARVLKSMATGITPLEIYEQKALLSLIENVSLSTKQEIQKKKGEQPAAERHPFSEYMPRQKSNMLYFIPEWDDRVDPNYDFEHDLPTDSRDPYIHDVYAHEIYKHPNYDGILISKSVIEANRQKSDRIRAKGIHAHVRVPRNFPIMGDCGAFNYINEKYPPYTTTETFEFYEALEFDFGVSVDHLILPEHLQKSVHFVIGPNGVERSITKDEFEELKNKGVKVLKTKPISRDLFDNETVMYARQIPDLNEAKRRWQITLKNSSEFMCMHRKRGARFVPIAGCQGWDVESQVEMFRLQQDMGFQYIALGGLVRSKTPYILDVLEAVNHIRKSRTKVHIFGVARPEAIRDFISQRVSSIDSARFLRQAWLSATSNYYTGAACSYKDWVMSHKIANNGEDEAPVQWRYTAIRIPPLFPEGGSSPTARTQKVLQEGHTLLELKKKEANVLRIIHDYDKGRCTLEETLGAVAEYDTLMGGDKKNIRLYRRTLEDKPWKRCPCDVCQKIGIDVVIFRRNNRNRRRGFHNTWWFFQFFSLLTSERVKARTVQTLT